MAQSSRKEPSFGDLTFEVQKLTTAQFAHGKDSSEYKTQHQKSVKLVQELNGIYGQGYASLSQARCVLQGQYIQEKEKAASDLAKALKNKKG